MTTCPHPLASQDCALTHGLLALPCATAAAVFAFSALLWLGKARRINAARAGVLFGALPTSFLASFLSSTLFLRMGWFRAHTDPTTIFVALLALTLGLEAIYIALVRPAFSR